MTISRQDGTFEFRGLPVGRYHLEVADLHITPTGPWEITIQGDTVVALEIPILPEDALSRCRSRPHCEALLENPTTAESDADLAGQLYLLGYRIAVAIAGTWPGDTEWVLCVNDADSVLEALRELHPHVSPGSECAVRRDGSSLLPLFHEGTGWRAMSVRRPVVDRVSEDRVLIEGGVTSGGRAGRGHACEVERQGGLWRVLTCYPTWIS